MSSNSKERLEARIHGRVQGVGFRYFTTNQAQRLGATGWVRNERDGTVTLVAEGDRSSLEKLLEAVHEGPSAAQVADVDADWKDAEDSFQSFGVRR